MISTNTKNVATLRVELKLNWIKYLILQKLLFHKPKRRII